MALSYPVLKWLAHRGVLGWMPGVRRKLGPSVRALRYLNDRWLATPFDDLAAAELFWQTDVPDAIDLALAAPRLDLTPSGAAKLPNNLRGYPPFAGLPELRQQIAGDREVEVLIGSGATGGFHTILDTYLNAGDKVVLFDPTSPMFSLSVRQRRGKIRWVPCYVENGRTRCNPNILARALSGAKMLVIANPATPTGAPWSADDCRQIVQACAKSRVLVVNDETLTRFRDDDEWLSLADCPEIAGQRLTINSLSKGHGLAAARVGWIVGDPGLIRPCIMTASLQQPFVATPMQTLAIAALKQGDSNFANVKADFLAKRRHAFERLQALGLEIAEPAGGYTLWTSLASLGMRGRAFAEELLREKRVLVTPGDVYGPSGEHHVRISCAIDDGRLREGLSRLADFVQSKRGPGFVPQGLPAAPEAKAA